MTSDLGGLWAAFLHGARSRAKDKGDLIGSAAMLVFVLVALIELWQAALGAHQGTLGGYDIRAIAWYVMGAEVAVNGVPSRLIETIGDEIGDGTITVAMLRPASVFGLRFAVDVGEAAARLGVLIPTGVLVTWIFGGAPPSLVALPVAIVAITLGVVTNLAFQHLFGAVAFWLRDAKSTWFLYQKIVFLPGGMLIPLELLPHGLAVVCRSLPFAAMAYVPGRIAAGYLDATLLLTQLFWLVITLVAASVTYSLGIRRLEVVGG